jgi:hypothetical protein
VGLGRHEKRAKGVRPFLFKEIGAAFLVYGEGSGNAIEKEQRKPPIEHGPNAAKGEWWVSEW